MKSNHHLVEHFFRHEYGRLVSLLTRALGIRHIDLVEDVVQGALSKAMISWKERPPNDPSGWLYRTAKNLALDFLRRKKLENGILTGLHQRSNWDPDLGDRDSCSECIRDETLRLMFLCCHKSLSLEDRVALALKTVCGFGTSEIASGLLIARTNAEKRLVRAKQRLREIGTEILEMDLPAMLERIEAVEATIYLIFNEGYFASGGNRAIRNDLCSEAIRLQKMIVGEPDLASPSSCALLALMLFHAARLDSRTDASGAIILLEKQDRTLWNWVLIREGMAWMIRSAMGENAGRYHIEAAIAWEHCRIAKYEELDWCRIRDLYFSLRAIDSSPMIQLNHAIALSKANGAIEGIEHLAQISSSDRARIRPWWDCAMAELYLQQGFKQEAISHWKDAVRLSQNNVQKDLIQRKIEAAMLGRS